MTAGELEEVFKLDFEPIDDKDLITVVKEEPEKRRTCGLARSHPFDPDGLKSRCGRPAVYEIDIADKPCGHPNLTILICLGCWNEMDQTPDYSLACTSCIKEGNKASTRMYIVKKHLVGWRKL